MVIIILFFYFKNDILNIIITYDWTNCIKNDPLGFRINSVFNDIAHHGVFNKINDGLVV